MIVQNFTRGFFLTFIAYLLTGCSGEQPYPPLLLQADSAYMQGHHTVGDSLLQLYELSNNAESEMASAYHHLLQLEQAFMRHQLNESLIPIGDSVCRYYEERGEKENYGKALLFLGSLTAEKGDKPTGLLLYLKANKIAEDTDNSRLKALVSRAQGNLYFSLHMLDDCKECYRRYYHLVSGTHDTLRLALAVEGMARVHTIENNVDSIIYFYKEAIRLGGSVPEKDDLLPYLNASLADIYIQTEQYGAAAAIMRHDELNDENWAYWHYGQNHVDSAIYYFRQMLGKYGWSVETENLRILAQLESEKGNVQQAEQYYKMLVDAEDSLKENSQKESVHRVDDQYNYNDIKDDRDRLADANQRMASLMKVALAAFVLLMAGIAASVLVKRKRRNRDNQHLEPQHNKKSPQVEALEELPIYKKVKTNVRERATLLNQEEWDELTDAISNAFPQFFHSIKEQTDLKENELRVCCLLRIGVQPVDVAPMIGRTKSAVSMMCKRIYTKLTQNTGSTKELVAYLMQLE